MPLLKRILGQVLAFPMLLASATLFGLMVLTFCDVILRSVLNAPVEAATELTRMAMAIVVFSALPVLSARGQHISVDLLDGLFTRWRLLRLRDGFVTLICGLILWVPANRVLALAERARDYGDSTEYLNIPTFYMGWFIAIMSFAKAVAMIARGLLLLFAPNRLDLFQHD